MHSGRSPFLLAILGVILATSPVNAGCFCGSQVYTYAIGGGGQTCSQVTTNLQNDVPGWADNYCINMGFDGSCMRTIQLGPCMPNPNTPGTVIINGSFSTHCLTCISIEPPPHGE